MASLGPSVEELIDQEARTLAEAEAPLSDPKAAARAAHLRYVSDQRPGIRRLKRGEEFRYEAPSGEEITDAKELARIKALAIPPAWTDVWICPYPNGHILATGRDARGRKQYRYHPKWREVRDETKYERMLIFGRALPKIRAQVEQDIQLPGLPKRKVLAAIVRLMESTLVRVGNAEYAKENNSYGLTTLRNKHVSVEGWKVKLDFKGKHGIRRRIELTDRRLASIVKKCRDLPGYELFEYVDEGGEVHDIGSGDVNDYLREIAGEEITAKDFRTWAGTNLAILALQEFERVDSQAKRKKHVMRAIERVAEELGNTPAICRKCYIHPAVFEAYLDGSLAESLADRIDEELRAELHEMSPEEVAVMAFLRQRLRVEGEQPRR
jgi:DNA topoisomerase-1